MVYDENNIKYVLTLIVMTLKLVNSHNIVFKKTLKNQKWEGMRTMPPWLFDARWVDCSNIISSSPELKPYGIALQTLISWTAGRVLGVPPLAPEFPHVVWALAIDSIELLKNCHEIVACRRHAMATTIPSGLRWWDTGICRNKFDVHVECSHLIHDLALNQEGIVLDNKRVCELNDLRECGARDFGIFLAHKHM